MKLLKINPNQNKGGHIYANSTNDTPADSGMQQITNALAQDTQHKRLETANRCGH
jgi:hypothetical protein